MTEHDNPAAAVASVDRCLELAATWHAWDGRPIARTIDGERGGLARTNGTAAWSPSTPTGPAAPNSTSTKPAPGCAAWPGGTCFRLS
jgi:hypothetical protein